MGLAIFFGGRLPDVLIEALLDRLEALLPARRIDEKTTVPQRSIAAAGADAAALGVATLPLYTSFAPAPSLLMKRTEAEYHRNHTPPAGLMPQYSPDGS